MKFKINDFVEILKEEYKSWNAPVITMMSNQGSTPFEILISTLLSLRTKDEVTSVASKRLFKIANTPIQMIETGEKKISELIYPVGFYPTKAKRIIEISKILLNEYDDIVPDEIDELLKFPGVGRKTANLVLIEGYGKKAICVDTHVHRISNRIGYVKTKNPDQTEFALRKKLPKKYWIIYNEILVAFGQTICKPISPFCSKCNVTEFCKKAGVTTTR
ncbi:MAG: endonuclease III [Desulfobacterales bacterium]|nr:endonuclease III [Desulfobacterales bacterium]MCP4159152.1 endonuclease III [Deltaproteobacteria bacterium]